MQEEIGFGGDPTPCLFKAKNLTSSSFPVSEDHIKPKFKHKLVDLWTRAGKGPVCELRRVADRS